MKTIRRMKILFSMWSVGRGGVTAAFGVLARYLESLGHDVKVVHDCRRRKDSALHVVPERYRLGWTPEIRCPFRHGGRPWLWLNCLFDWKFLFCRWSACADFDYDCLVLFNGYDLNAYIMRFARRKPSIMWLHEVAGAPRQYPTRRLGFTRRLLKWSSERAMRGFDEYVAVSQLAAGTQREIKGLKNTPKVIYNLIDIPDIDKKAKIPQADIVKGDSVNIVYLGRLSPEKGVDRLIDALADIKKNTRKFKLWIVGANDINSRVDVETELKNRVNWCELDDVVRFLGEKTNPYPYLKACDLMVLPSRMEGMGIVIWESLVCGTPVIATDSGGPREALNDGKWGAVVENTTDGIRRGIMEFLEGRLSFDMVKIRSEVIAADAENREKIKELFDGIAMRA